MSTANVVANDAAPGLTRLREIEAQFSEKISGTGVTDGNAFSALVANVPAANSATPAVTDNSFGKPRIVPLSQPEIEALAAHDASSDALRGIEPDTALPAEIAPVAGKNDATAFAEFRLGDIFTQASAALERAQHAERAVAEGGGSVLEMSVERAKANAMLSVAGAAASKISTAFSTFVNMAV